MMLVSPSPLQMSVVILAVIFAMVIVAAWVKRRKTDCNRSAETFWGNL